MDIREALPTFLKATAAVTDLVAERIYPVIRPQAADAPCILFRVTKGLDGEAIDGDTGEREYTVELVVWARDYLAAAAIGAVLKSLFHGTGGYALGDLTINESSKTAEYDGDRVTDSYADEGDYAITFAFEFQWVA